LLAKRKARKPGGPPVFGDYDSDDMDQFRKARELRNRNIFPEDHMTPSENERYQEARAKCSAASKAKASSEPPLGLGALGSEYARCRSASLQRIGSRPLKRTATEHSRPRSGMLDPVEYSSPSGSDSEVDSAPSQAPLVTRANPKPYIAHAFRVCIVGDSGLRLKKSKGTAGFEADLKCMLGPNLEIVTYPGEGAEAITKYISSMRGVAHIVVAVWFLNELFSDAKQLVSVYPQRVNTLAKKLAKTLLQFPYQAAVIGGSAALWDVPGEFDIWAKRIRDAVSEEGVFVVDGVAGYSTLALAKDHWLLVREPGKVGCRLNIRHFLVRDERF